MPCGDKRQNDREAADHEPIDGDDSDQREKTAKRRADENQCRETRRREFAQANNPKAASEPLTGSACMRYFRFVVLRRDRTSCTLSRVTCTTVASVSAWG